MLDYLLFLRTNQNFGIFQSSAVPKLAQRSPRCRTRASDVRQLGDSIAIPILLLNTTHDQLRSMLSYETLSKHSAILVRALVYGLVTFAFIFEFFVALAGGFSCRDGSHS